jgi:hypothetical protein
MNSAQLRVCLVGQPYWCARLNGILNEYAGDALALKAVSLRATTIASAFHQAAISDITLRVGFRPGSTTCRGTAVDFWWAALQRAARGQRRIFFWIGTDVQQTVAAIRAGEIRKNVYESVKREEHLADAPWLATELASVGIDARVIPIFAGRLRNVEPPPLPDRFTVLTYLPDARHEFYGSSMILAAACALPEVEFLVVGGHGMWMTQSLPNLTFLGWREDLGQFYARSSAVVRMVEHDGMSGMVAEALSFGRHVIYSYPMPHCHTVQFGDVERLVKTLSSLEGRSVNAEGWRYAIAEFNQATTARSLAEYLRKGA